MMNRRNLWTAALAGALVLPALAYAQAGGNGGGDGGQKPQSENRERGERGERGGRGGGERPGGGGGGGGGAGADRGQMRERIMQGLRQQMGATDEQWKTIEPKLDKV